MKIEISNQNPCCANCYHGMKARIPDPDRKGHGGITKPKIDGFICANCRPVYGGKFPFVKGEYRCPCWTDKDTLEQPLLRFTGANADTAKAPITSVVEEY